MYATVEKKESLQLDMLKLSGRKRKTMTSKEALKEITPIEWSDDSFQEKRKCLFQKKMAIHGSKWE